MHNKDHPTASDWAEKLQLKKIGTQAFAGPCPLCGGDDRFHVTQRGPRALVGCRGCIDNEKPHTRAKRYGDLIETVFPELSRRRAPQTTTRNHLSRNTDAHKKRHAKSPIKTTKNDNNQARNILPLLLWDLSTDLFPGPGAQYLINRKLHPNHEPVTAFKDIRWIKKKNCPRNHPGWPGLPEDATGAIIVSYRQYENIRAVLLEAITSKASHTTTRWRRVFGKPNGAYLKITKDRSAQIVITEGYTSALATHWLYPDHDVVSIGSTSNTGHIARNFKSNFEIKHIIIDTDGDEGGHTAAWSLYHQLREQKINPALLLRMNGDAADELYTLINKDNKND